MKINGKDNQFDNQHIANNKLRKSDINYEEKDIANSPNPAEYLGRSQIVFRGKDKTNPKFKPVKLYKTPLLTKEEATNHLKKYYFTDEDIKALDLEDKETLSQISNFRAYLKSGIINEETDLKDFKENMENSSPEDKKRWLKEQFSGTCKYANKKNIEIIKNYINIKNDNDLYQFITFLQRADYGDKFLEKLPIITYIQGKLNTKDLQNFRYNPDTFYDKITPERAEILHTINEVMPDDMKMKSAKCSSLGEDKDLTPELAKEYCERFKELSKIKLLDKSSLQFDFSGDDLKTATDKMNKVSKMLKDYPVDLTSTNEGLNFINLYQLTERDDKTETQKYINSLSNDAKLKGILRLKDTDIPKDKLVNICNILFDKDYGRFSEDKLFDFIEKEIKEEPNSANGLINMLAYYKGTEELDTYYPERKLYVGNKDYAGATEAIKLKHELQEKNLIFNDSDFGRILYDKTTNFEDFNKVLAYMRDNDIKYYEYPNKIYTSHKGLEKLTLRDYTKKHNYYIYEKSLETLDNIAENITSDDDMNFVKKYLLEKNQNGLIFTVENVQKLFNEYKKHPESINKVLNIKTDSGYLRYTDISSISALADAYDIDKDYTEFVLKLKDEKRDRRRFISGTSVKNVVEASKIDKPFVNVLLACKVKYDELGRPKYFVDNDILDKLNKNEIPYKEETEEQTSYRFSADSIKQLAEAHTTDKELTEYLMDKYSNINTSADCIKYIVEKSQKDKKLVYTLIDAKETIYNNEKRDRFTSENVKEILENAPENSQFIYDLLNAAVKEQHNKKVSAPKYSVSDIIYLCKSAKTDENLTRKFMNMNYSYKRKTARFQPCQIEGLIKDYNTDKILFNRLLYKTTEDYNGEMKPLYSATEIHSIMEIYPHNKKLVKQLLDVNDRHKKPVYSTAGILSIVQANEIDSEYTNYLLSKKAEQSNGKKYPLVQDLDVYDIVTAHKKEPEYTEKLLNILYKNYYGDISLAYRGGEIKAIVQSYEKDKELTEKLVKMTRNTEYGKTNRFNGNDIQRIVSGAQSNKDLVNYLIDHKTVQKDGSEEYTYGSKDIIDFIDNSGDSDHNYLQRLFELNVKDEYGNSVPQFSPQEVLNITKNSTFKEFKIFEGKVGENIDKYSSNDLLLGIKFIDTFKKDHISEVSIRDKKHLLRELVSANADLFNRGEQLKSDFPLLPANQEEYCSLLPSLVRSLGIETNVLTDKQTAEFNKSINKLAVNIANLSDREFNNLTITQEYDKDKFITDVLNKVKDLTPKERQKVYDYYGFELLKNNGNQKTGYSIMGYPVNLNNGKKLEEITDENTKKAVEDLRENVIKFSDKNKIKCNDKRIEEDLNKIVNVLPEIRTMIGKRQHETHDFDVFKHSLKVMQKIRQDNNFDCLNDSDKKVILISSLMHDITKAEGTSDPTHPRESSYDTFFIAKKFNLTKDEELKLYTLIKHHEWLLKVNTAGNAYDRTKRLQSVAFDLQQGNLFDMALMFTHADLKAVKNNDRFHDKKEGDSRKDFTGQVRSFGESADFYAKKIKEYVKELQKSQPILPVTKMPKASTIEKAITKVNSDGSTNIKGVYKDKDGLVIIKFNEVEDWEKLGLPKGSTTKGIFAPGIEEDNRGNQSETTVETGNIKFFVHGLDFPNQLAKFDAFSMVDSDALLSVSYAERPETKYRFFRPQGIMLDVPTEYVHGGGNTDAGSGCGKNIQNFKDDYIFGGYREKDRLYISELVKEATGMNDEEYTEFVQNNKDKSMTEIQPEKLRNDIIKKFATINSNTRKGNRAYNEMYISNPKSVMGVFAYEMNEGEKIKDPLQFLKDNNDRTDFLKEYAKSHDIPFYVFGD